MARVSRQTAPAIVPASPVAESEDLRRSLDLAEKRIVELEGELARQGRVRTEIIHLVAHELRTPITVISGFSRLLLEDGCPARLTGRERHFVEETLRACRRLDQFVGDLLEAGPAEASPLSIEPVDADLRATIEAPLEALAPLLAERGMRVERCFATGLERFGFDPRRIEQVVTNLMTNAIRYGRPRGVVRVTTGIEARPDGERVVRVSVEDDGCGIPEHDRDRLFAPYVRGEAQARSGGLGIGLAICRRIVASHGGTIRVDRSELGGARFFFTLPLRPAGRGDA